MSPYEIFSLFEAGEKRLAAKVRGMPSLA